MKRVFVAWCLSLIVPVAAAAAPIEASFVSNSESIHPGKRFKVGVLFKVEAPWHIYWKNPGEAGLPTRVSLELPPGYSAGELMWPVPSEFKQEGNLIGYGYQGAVLLFQEVTPPGALEFGTMARLKAEVRWVGCFNVCVPGRSSLSLDLPVGDGRPSEKAALFEEWKHRLPWAYQGEKRLFAYNISGTTPPPGGESDWTLTIEWPFAPKSVGFFPLPMNPFSVSGIQRETAGNATHVQFKVSRREGVETGSGQLEGVISFEGEHESAGAVSLPLNAE